MFADMPAAIVHYTPHCIEAAARRFQLPITVLYSILKVEGGKEGHKNYNKNGTYDMGPMQINSTWLPVFKHYISENEIINNGCTNILVGAWILRAQINLAGGNFWQGVGNYHSRTALHNSKYQWKVYAASLQLRGNNVR